MALTTLKYLIYLQSKRGFKRELELVENIFKVYDLENDRTFVKYDDLQLLINFATKLQERGWIEGTDFYFNTVGIENRLTLVNGNMMVEYDEWHDLEFLEKPMPPVYEGFVKYFSGALLNIKRGRSIPLTVESLPNTNTVLIVSLGDKIDLTETPPDPELTITIS